MNLFLNFFICLIKKYSNRYSFTSLIIHKVLKLENDISFIYYLLDQHFAKMRRTIKLLVLVNKKLNLGSILIRLLISLDKLDKKMIEFRES